MPKSKTTQVPRPMPRAGSDDERRSRLGDFTRPIPVDRKVSNRPAVALIATVIVLAVLATLAFVVFVAPMGTWRAQDDKLAQLEAQFEELSRVNGELQAETDRLRTPEGVVEAAREEIGYIEAGETRTSVQDFPMLTAADMPAGWPYSIVGAMIQVRAGSVAAPASAATQAPPDE